MTDYVEKIATQEGTRNIGGYQFDTTWTLTSTTQLASGTLAAKTTKSISLANYLPQDNYNYEVLVSGRMWSNSSSTNNQASMIISNSVGYWARLNCVRTTFTNYASIHAGAAIVPILASNKTISVYNDTNYTSGSYWFYVHGYRRLGTNG